MKLHFERSIVAEWHRKNLGDVAEILRGTSYAGKDLGADPGSPILIGMGEIAAGGGLDLRDARRFVGRVREGQILKSTDVILAMTDLTQDGRLLGSAAQLTNHHLTDQYVVSHHLQIVRSTDEILPTFIRFLLSTPRWYAYVRGVSTGTTVRAVSVEDAKRFSFSLPPIEYQHRIVEVLSPIVEKIESNQRLGQLIEDEFRAVFDVEFDVSPKSSGVALTDVVKINPKRRFPSDSTEAPFLPMSSLPIDSAIVASWESRIVGSGQKYINGDVIMARITPCLENGKAAIVDFLDEGQVGFGSTEFLVFAGPDEPLTVWLYCLVRSPEFREFAIRHMTGTSGRQRCQSSAFDNYRLESFDRSRIRAFCKQFSQSLEMLAQIRNENRALRAELNALLPGTICGAIKVAG